MGDGRVQIAVRVSPAALSVIEQMARDDERSRSEMIRKLLAEAVAARARK